MNCYRIRKMDITDVRYVHDCELKEFSKSFGKKMYYDEIITNHMAHYYILLVDDVRSGYIGFWITDPNAEITTIYVEPMLRKQGFGIILALHAIDICKLHHVKALTLEVRYKNQAAIALYERLGFNVVSTRKAYYANGDDALLMYLELGGVQ